MASKRLGFVAACLLCCISRMGFGEELLPNTRLILDFEDAAIWMSENDSPFETSTEHVTQGKKSLKVQYTNKPEWSNVQTRTLPGDWSGYRYLNFDLFLGGDAGVEYGMWIRDKAHHKAEASFRIGPGINTLTVDLDELQRNAELDRANIVALCLYKNCKEEITVYLDNMYLSKQPPKLIEAELVAMPAAELLQNGGFEDTQKPDELGNPFKWWTARRWEGASFLGAGTNAVYSGKSSAMLDGRGVCKIGFISPAITVKYPTKLKLTAYVAGDGLKKGLWGQVALLCVTDAGERDLDGASVVLPEGTFGWKKVELVLKVPDKCPQVKVFIQLYGPGRLWIDDVSLAGADLTAKLGATITDTGKELKPDAPIVSETPELLKKKADAQKAMEELKAAVAEAKKAGVETLYDEIPLMLGELAFKVRWDMPQHLKLREGYADYVLKASQAAIRHLKVVTAKKAPDLKVPPHPDFTKLTLKGRYYCEGDDPKILFSMQYHNRGELIKWFCPEGYDGDVPAVGGTRYDFQQMPIWKVYQQDPDTHRVYDDGWCGHIIRDKNSAGGSDRCVINLDHPKMQEAIAQSIAIYCERLKKKLGMVYINLGFEYSYVNYDQYSLEKFRRWLEAKYKNVGALNAAWKTGFASFADVTTPDYAPDAVEPNPAKYYDWGAFNLWRFTDYMKWAKGEIRKVFPNTATTTGGGEPFGAGFWRQGIDEEMLLKEGVNDIFLSETGSRALGTTSVMDLQRSLADKPTLILDPEYHALPNTCFLMFLHGCGVMDYWWWPDDASDFYDSSMKHSHLRSLPEVEAVMKTALDVRRLVKYIAPFPEAQASIALLYPRASLIQRFPGAEGHKTPYTLEVEKTYGSAVMLDTPVGFVSSRRVLEGIPANIKIVAVPGARFVEGDVFDKLKVWTEAGGTLVITPTSLVADEYNRKRDYLKALGIEITGEELPEFMAGEAKRGIDQSGELDFIQGPIAKTVVKKEPQREITLDKKDVVAGGLKKLNAAGVIQQVKVSADWQTLASYAGEKAPAILTRTLGRGKVYYLAAQLDVLSRKAFFDKLLENAGVERLVRAYGPKGVYLNGVESRTVSFEGGLLTYLQNTTGEPQVVELKAKKKIVEIENVNTETKVASPKMTLAPYETRIMKIKTK